MSMVRILMCLAAVAMLINSAIATTFTVGGPSGGWDTITNLKAWSSSQVFSVGDSLAFQYTPNHNVVEVSKEDYDACQTTNPIQVYSTGTTPIPLIAPGSRYFICGAGGHCSLGMKVEIVTLVPSVQSPAPSPEFTTLPSEPIVTLAPYVQSPASSPELTTLPSEPPFFPAEFSAPTPMPISQPPASRGPGPTTLPSFPQTGSPQSFSQATAFSTLPPPSSAAKETDGSSLGFAVLMVVLLFL